jgi:hypothetical protein
MNKTLSTVLIIWMLLSITENVISIERTKEYQERQEFLDSRYEKLNSRLEVYEELVSPKTTQFYVDELKKIVDNIHRLGKIVDKGEDIETYLNNLEEQIDAAIMVSEDHYNHMYEYTKDLSGVVDEMEKYIEFVDYNFKDYATLQDTVDAEQWDDILLLKQSMESGKRNMEKIKESKIGKKIFQ